MSWTYAQRCPWSCSQASLSSRLPAFSQVTALSSLACALWKLPNPTIARRVRTVSPLPERPSAERRAPSPASRPVHALKEEKELSSYFQCKPNLPCAEQHRTTPVTCRVISGTPRSRPAEILTGAPWPSFTLRCVGWARCRPTQNSATNSHGDHPTHSRRKRAASRCGPG